ncbi:MAG TPA: hypothetical protein DDX98_06095 [Bacteroidales bacterium]|jgi:arylsulfatase A-like enzyme|nr:hypothetical protein [Bacteroidales bacterium]
MQRILISLMLLPILLSCGQGKKQASAEASDKALPNIVLIIGDDHGYPYFGFMGADYVKTPAMDKLANSGTLFAHSYVPTNHCAPSLQTLLTGTLPIQYSQQVQQLKEKTKAERDYENLSADEQKEIDREFRFLAMQHFETLPRILSKHGYVSWQGGKWWEFNYHNGGFDSGMTKGWKPEQEVGDDFFHILMGGEGTELIRKTMQPFYDFVDANASKPKFMWFAPELPHYPLDAPQEYYDMYKDKKMTESAKRYYANCTWFDDGIKDMMKYLKEKGEFDNTLFVYVNDNGWEQAPDQEFRHDSLRWHNGGDKGKLSMYDMSFRTPVIFSWKENIEAGVVKNDLFHSADIPATILDLIGVDVPEEYYGISQKTVIEGKASDLRTEIIGNIDQVRWEGDMMGRNLEGYWIRTRNWFFNWDATTGEKLLFDMNKDPNNDFNLADKNPKLVAEFTTKIETWKKQMGR